MWDLAVREADYRAVDAMLARYKGAPLSFRILPAYARHDSAAMQRLREEARNLDARQSQIAARYVAVFLEDFDAAAELATLDLQPRRNAGIRLTAQTFLAWLEVARGRWPSADSAFLAAERIERESPISGSGATVRTDHALAATLDFLAAPAADVERLRREIESWTAAPDATPSLASSLRPALRLYILGLLSSRLKEDAAAETYAQRLDQLAVPAGARNVPRALAATVRADVALRARRYEDVLRLLAVADGELPLELVAVRPFVNTREFTQEHARWLRAQALVALGRNDEARRWLEYGFQGSPWELAFLAPVHERLAHVLLAAGDEGAARRHRAAFARLWRAAPTVAR